MVIDTGGQFIPALRILQRMLGDSRIPVAILGSGNIGTDLMVKTLRTSHLLRLVALAGIDPGSDGLARARDFGVATTAEGIEGLLDLVQFKDVRIVFDATSAGAHARHNELLARSGVRLIDLTPAALGPYVVPVVNLDTHLSSANINMVTCGGQATIPIVAAISRVTPVAYAEIVASIASRSAGPGTRANIDEFTATTADALVRVGGAQHGKAIIVLNPAEPPLLMRNTVFCLVDGGASERELEKSIADMVKSVATYVRGYRLKQAVQFERLNAANVPQLGKADGLKISVFLEIEGAAHYLPAYAGNLDIMTSAALAAGERLAVRALAA
jgi:acetaldehyde dehydrogenase